MPNDLDDKVNYPDYVEQVYEFTVPDLKNAQRLDVFLTNNIKNASRAKVQKAVEEQLVTVNGLPAKSSRKLKSGDKVVCKILKPPPLELIPEDIHLDIVHEDDYIVIVNKPPGMVVHPGVGNRRGTLVNALLYHLGEEPKTLESPDDEEEEAEDEEIFLDEKARPCIVHRLDKDTSGLLVAAKNDYAHSFLSGQFAERTVDKTYYALVWGDVKNRGKIEANIGRSSRDRKKFAVTEKGGKPALTEYKKIEDFRYLSLVEIKLRTGRTHQIRVHFSHINKPVFGDSAYAGNSVVYGGENTRFKKFAQELLKFCDRQLLHAKTLEFTHPDTKERASYDSNLPSDFEEILSELRANKNIIWNA